VPDAQGRSSAAAPEWTVADVGVGDAIVLVHGLGTDSSAWNRVTPDLAKDHRVVTVDLPGYSLRSVVEEIPSATALADRLDALLGRLGIASAVFVGHSFGGAVSLITARRHAARCAGLVLIAPGGFGTELNPLIPLIGTRFGSRLLRTLYGARASRTIERVAARVEARTLRSGQTSRVRIAELMETYDRLRSEEAREQFRTSVQESLALNAGVDRADLARIDPCIPILVLWGREDRVLPPWHAKNATDLLPWSTVHLLDGAGHTPHRSHPDQTNREIRAFADSAIVQRRLSPTGS
jgi:pimeloyl-ACP methyl ester carboxylesterase